LWRISYDGFRLRWGIVVLGFWDVWGNRIRGILKLVGAKKGESNIQLEINNC